jgi:hypothetical protein
MGAAPTPKTYRAMTIFAFEENSLSDQHKMTRNQSFSVA